MLIKHLTDQQYDTAMVCVDVFTKCAAVLPVKGKSENDLALGVIESIVVMGKPFDPAKVDEYVSGFAIKRT